ncbi:hypothetical protein FM114_08245 [Luteococcus japonicus LSP_Lj1]|uniref:ACT domain-containing protein n=1 Tax=Luteococcus japonicus LSP_Lj1 TaxID=1255658 RepID=A0A1R4JLS5_9ACTN|nr:hypothetical protein FM114_08245 [Luteococcus japonicus LSP_Lj1]
MHLLRVQLPDRPGSLGVVASAMGLCGADITAMEIVEKGDGWVIDDFMLTMPKREGVWIDDLVSTCNAIDGVRVLWISRHPEGWGLEADIAVLERMVAERERAVEILTLAAPQVFHCQWAALLDRRDGSRLVGTELAPDFTPGQADGLGPLDELTRLDLAAGWLPHWSDTTVAICPVDENQALVLGRAGGPDFLDSELRRLSHLAALA